MEGKNPENSKKIILKEILPIFIISRVLIFLIGIFSTFIILKDKFFGNPKSFLDLFFRWDSGWYLSIVNKGYSYIPGKESNVNFFPLYPFIVKIFSFVFGHPVLIGFVLSNIFLFFALIYLYKLTKLDFNDESLSLRIIFYLLIFPVSFFFSIFYSESLFLLLSISCFYYSRKKKWLIASIFGYFASLTRIFGVLLFIPLIIEYLDIDFKNFKLDFKKIKKDFLFLLFVPFGLFSFMIYLYFKFNDSLAYIHTRYSWQQKLFSVTGTFNTTLKFSLFYRILFFGFLIFSIIMIIYMIYSKIRISYIVYSILILITCLISGSLEGFPRFISVIFPLYITIASISKNSKSLDCFFLMLSIMLLALSTILFVNGYWFT